MKGEELDYCTELYDMYIHSSEKRGGDFFFVLYYGSV